MLSGVAVSELTPPIPVFRLLLELSSAGALAAGDFFPEPRYLSAWPGFIETIRPGLQEAPSGTLRGLGILCNRRIHQVQDMG